MVYVEQMDQFLIVRVVTQRAGCMGINDTRSQEETFYTFGDTAEIFLPATRYEVEYKGDRIFSRSLRCLPDRLLLSYK